MYLTKSLKTNVIHLLKKKNFFKGATKDGIMFKNVLEYCQFFFWTNEGCISNTFIIIVKKDGDLISNKKEPVELFNQNYINIAENFRKETFITWRLFKYFSRWTYVKDIISVYNNHPRIQKIKGLSYWQ